MIRDPWDLAVSWVPARASLGRDDNFVSKEQPDAGHPTPKTRVKPDGNAYFISMI